MPHRIECDAMKGLPIGFQAQMQCGFQRHGGLIRSQREIRHVQGDHRQSATLRFQCEGAAPAAVLAFHKPGLAIRCKADCGTACAFQY